MTAPGDSRLAQQATACWATVLSHELHGPCCSLINVALRTNELSVYLGSFMHRSKDCFKTYVTTDWNQDNFLDKLKCLGMRKKKTHYALLILRPGYDVASKELGYGLKKHSARARFFYHNGNTLLFVVSSNFLAFVMAEYGQALIMSLLLVLKMRGTAGAQS
jgi:hypothetical protein